MTRRAATIVVALVALALVGVALLAIPSSPIHKKTTLGLDLQGGLEVTLQGRAAEGPAAHEGRPRPLGRRSCATASTGSASPSPRSASRAPTRSRFSCPASRIPLPRRRSSARRRSSSSSTSRRILRRPRSTPSRFPVPKELGVRAARRSAGACGKGNAGAVLALRREEEARRGPGRDQGGGAAQARRQGADRVQAVRRAPGHRRRLVRPERHLPGRRDVPTRLWYLLQLRPAEGAGDDGRRPQAERYAAGLRPAIEPADRDDAVHGRGREEVRRDHAARGAARKAALQHDLPVTGAGPRAVAAALRDRARPRDQVVAVDRLAAVPGRHLGLERRPDQRQLHASARRRTSRSCCRPAPCRSSSSRSTRRDLGHAGQGLAQRGEEGGRRRPALGRAVPARLLSLPRSRRRARPRHLRRIPVRRDPPLQRHPDAARLRGARADTGGGRRRERRHLRAHQGGIARRPQRARGDPDGLHQGLRDDRRRECRHRDHGARALRGRHRVGARLRADAADRYRDLDAHRGARDPGAAVVARRLQVVREPALRRRRRPRHSRLAEARLHRPPHAVVRDLGRPSSPSRCSRSRSRGSTSASTSRAAHSSRSRRRRRSRSTSCAHRRPRSVMPTPSSRVAAPRRTATTRASRSAPRR